MFPIHTLASLVRQLSRMVPDPSARFKDRGRHTSHAVEGGCGLCPACREFVFLDLDGANVAPCPRCGAAIEGVEPLGPG